MEAWGAVYGRRADFDMRFELTLYTGKKQDKNQRTQNTRWKAKTSRFQCSAVQPIEPMNPTALSRTMLQLYSIHSANSSRTSQTLYQECEGTWLSGHPLSPSLVYPFSPSPLITGWTVCIWAGQDLSAVGVCVYRPLLLGQWFSNCWLGPLHMGSYVRYPISQIFILRS